MKDDVTLLHLYAAEGSQEAFGELVHRHLSLVYHAALRQTNGDPHRAGEVAQLVFTELARQAAALSRRPLLVAWLHTTTRYVASHQRRTERRRQAREQEAFAMNEPELDSDPAADWERLRPLIDDALQTLGDRDRAAVLLRFFENRSYAELAAALSVSEDAARVRVNRALEKLRATLARRGLVSTASALGLALTQPTLAATPAGLAASITTASLATASATTASLIGTAASLGTVTFMSTVKIAATTAGALALLSVGVVLYQRPPAPAKTAAAPAPALSPADLAAILRPARLAPAEAAAALAAYLALPPLAADATPAEFLDRSARLRALLTLLPSEQFAQLLSATATRAGDPEARLRGLAFTTWAELDSPAAARWAADLKPGAAIKWYHQREFAREAAHAWARTDFDAAYAWTLTLRADFAQYVGGHLLARLVRTDTDRALKLARAGDLVWFDAVREPIFEAWLDQDPAAAFATLGSEMFASPAGREDLQNHLAHWAWRDPRAALEWLDTQAPGEPRQRAAELKPLIARFAEKTPPPDFAAFASALTARGYNELDSFLIEWMSHDTPAALHWFDALPDASLREEILRASLTRGAYEDPAKLVQLARRLPADARRTQAVDDIVNRWSQKAPDAALTWLESPEASALVGPETAQVARIGATARQDPAAALATWNAIASEQTRLGAAPTLARAWAVSAPDAATTWLFAQLPEQRSAAYLQHEVAYNQIGSTWLARDPAGFVAWIESLPDAAHQHRAAYTLTWNAAIWARVDRPDPADRLALIATLRDPSVRDPLLRDYLREWHRYDENSARRWAAGHAAESLLPAAKNAP